MSGVYETALAALEAELCVFPCTEDGEKKPYREWSDYQKRRSTRDEVEDWYAGDRRSGLGYIMGAVSKKAECLDFDEISVFRAFVDLAEAAGLADVVERVEAGYLEETPSGGRHWVYRCETIDGNTKLARRLKRPEEMEHDKDTTKTLIETKGEGGYIVAAPSNGRVHESGRPYRLLRGGVATIATITPEEREEFFALGRSFDQMPKEEPREARTATTGGGKPGDEYNERGEVVALLEEHGWSNVYEKNGIVHLRRPGKKRGVSATFGYGGTRYFYVFTTSTDFEAERAYSPFAVYAKLEHEGDFSAAAQALAELGYGEPAATLRRSAGAAHSVPTHEWPVLDGAALYGLAGDVVRAIEPHTEGDPMALLLNFLTMFGSAVGSSPYAPVGATRHHANLFVVHVGETARSRKGTAHSEVERLLRLADPSWKERVMGGLSSGEGLIHAVRDASHRIDKEGHEVIADPGVDDKRLLAVEPEFASVLGVAARDGNTLTEVLRRAWDGNDLRVMTRNSPLRATAPHVSLSGHITREELLRKLDATDQVNGFANRFLFLCVRRSKHLPHGGTLGDLEIHPIVRCIWKALAEARRLTKIARDAEANVAWEAVYPMLTADRPGMLGAITARAEAHVLRLSLVYALLDGASAIQTPHLNAALAVWQYAEDSATYIFGDATGDPIADRVLAALRSNGAMSQNELVDLFGRHVRATTLSRALESLVAAGMVASEQVETGGRPRTVWKATS